VPEFAKTYKVVTFDHRSFGQSRDLPDGPGPRAFVQDLTVLLDHLGIQKAAVAGQSMGGWTVCGFAAAHPERTTALILCDTTAGVESPEVTKAQAGLQERSRGNLAQILKSAYSRQFPERQPALCFLYQQISALNTHVTPNLAPLLFGLKHDITPIVERKIPTLLLVGEEDVLTPPQSMASVAAQIPQARFVRVPQAGHSVYFERADEFNHILGEFLRGQMR
jgi:3-oxoadipate enol-lactonase